MAVGGVRAEGPAATGGASGVGAPADGASSAGACGRCLRRGALVGMLAPRITGLLQARRPRPTKLLELTDKDLVAALGGRHADDLRRWLRRFDFGDARRRLREVGLESVCRHSPAYPRALLDLSDPPAALYVTCQGGRLAALAEEPVATVVGGRKATPYALQVGEAIGRGLAAAGVTVVSGLALGVDAAAHRGATAAGGRVIAVLAGGADVPYPRSNTGLYRTIRAGGAVLAELPPGTAPSPWSFPARNRIMAALGGITVVVEATERSGSLITAAFAADLGREVGAVPGQVTADKAAGSNRLLRDGARVVRGPEDVLDELFGVGALAAEGVRGRERRRVLAQAADRHLPERDLEPPVRRVLEAVESGHRADAIGREAGLAPGEVRAALGRLELLGLVVRDGLGLYQRTA